LIIRYQDLALNNPGAEQRQLILDTVRLMMTPCLYAALTTIAGFGSLLLCDLLPVKAFGWMMIAGIIVSMGITFLLFPAALMLVHKKYPRARRAKRRSRYSLTSFLAGFTGTYGKTILVSSGIIFGISLFGISRLVVENSFINYFKDTTEIYQGLKVIDQKLGGTSPLDVIIEVDEPETSSQVPAPGTNAKGEGEFEEFDEFKSAKDDERYWFTADKMARITRIHDYLDSLPETGKVVSLATMLKIAEDFNKGQPLDNFQLALLYGELPDKFRTMVLKPYVSVGHNQVRFAIRVRDSDQSLRRDELLKKIKYDLIHKLGLREDHVHLTGLLVLYNNMLQSLFESQILTLGVVVIALMGMFLILFRSFKITLIAITPNLLAIGAVLGVIGWLNIPLDMMTITIAAISMGIAVDNTIHYIYRFRQEFNVEHNYVRTVFNCHGSIGYAMYYTSVTIIIGFSILALSNFLPTIYFGLLTGLAMLVALIASLTLLPQLLIVFKPFGPEIEVHQN
jgi:predicted RND superfamily exporter protein